ncbi:MAG: hypothetical protein WC236_09050 [Gallionellaceae bacterium]
MNKFGFQLTGRPVLRGSILLAFMFVLSGAALADRPDWAGQDGENGKKQKHKQGRDEEGRYQSRQGSIEINVGGYFGERQRTDTNEYYKKRSHAGHCPPGLAKKKHGCVPPGHAKKWAMGERLPRDVTYQSIDPAISIKLGTPPAGHKFVRVATDILLIAVGTGMVIDAIQDLGQ